MWVGKWVVECGLCSKCSCHAYIGIYMFFLLLIFFDFYFLRSTNAKAKKCWRELLHWVFRDCLGPPSVHRPGGRLTHFLPPTSSTIVTFRKVVGVIKAHLASWHLFIKTVAGKIGYYKRLLSHPGQERACTRIIGCLLGTMPKMAQYTGKWLLLSPYWSHPRPHKIGKRDD